MHPTNISIFLCSMFLIISSSGMFIKTIDVYPRKSALFYFLCGIAMVTYALILFTKSFNF